MPVARGAKKSEDSEARNRGGQKNLDIGSDGRPKLCKGKPKGAGQIGQKQKSRMEMQESFYQ